MGFTYPDKFTYLNTFVMELGQSCSDNGGPTLSMCVETCAMIMVYSPVSLVCFGMDTLEYCEFEPKEFCVNVSEFTCLKKLTILRASFESTQTPTDGIAYHFKKGHPFHNPAYRVY